MGVLLNLSSSCHRSGCANLNLAKSLILTFGQNQQPLRFPPPINRRKKPIFNTFLLRHIFGVPVLIKQGNLIVFQPCKSFLFIVGDADILHYVTTLELLVIRMNRQYLTLSVYDAHPTNRKSINLAFMPPPPTALAKKDT